MFENNYKDECASHHQQTQSKAKKLRLWTIGVALLTAVLFAVATALILFVPPVAAVALPLFTAIYTTIGSLSPLLLLTALLPSSENTKPVLVPRATGVSFFTLQSVPGSNNQGTTPNLTNFTQSL